VVPFTGRKNSTLIQFVAFGVVGPCSVVVGYRRFRGPFCLYLWTAPQRTTESIFTAVKTANPPILL